MLCLVEATLRWAAWATPSIRPPYTFRQPRKHMHIHMQNPYNTPHGQWWPLMQCTQRLPASPPPWPFSVPKHKKMNKSKLTLFDYLWVPPSYIPLKLLCFRGFSLIHLNLIKVRGEKLIAESILAQFSSLLASINFAWHHRPYWAEASWGVSLSLSVTLTTARVHPYRQAQTEYVEIDTFIQTRAHAHIKFQTLGPVPFTNTP